MGLWIRSQDKEHLELTTYLQVGKIIKNDKEVYFIEGGEILGYYKSKKRALEVLTEIQDKLTDKYLMQPDFFVKPQQLVEKKIAYEKMNSANFITAETGFNITPITVGTTVYEMPEE